MRSSLFSCKNYVSPLSPRGPAMSQTEFLSYANQDAKFAACLVREIGTGTGVYNPECSGPVCAALPRYFETDEGTACPLSNPGVRGLSIST
jgi:hypothetical protein